MVLFCAVKINLIVFFVVKVRKWKPIWVSVITEERQNSALFIFQNLFAFAIRNLLLEPSHWSERNIYFYFLLIKYNLTSQIAIPKTLLQVTVSDIR